MGSVDLLVTEFERKQLVIGKYISQKKHKNDREKQVFTEITELFFLSHISREYSLRDLFFMFSHSRPNVSPLYFQKRELKFSITHDLTLSRPAFNLFDDLYDSLHTLVDDGLIEVDNCGAYKSTDKGKETFSR